MPTLIWRAPMHYYSPRDEAIFFEWLGSVPGVVSIQGRGTELHIQLRSKRLSQKATQELVAIYKRYKGDLKELAPFLAPKPAIPGSA